MSVPPSSYLHGVSTSNSSSSSLKAQDPSTLTSGQCLNEHPSRISEVQSLDQSSLGSDPVEHGSTIPRQEPFDSHEVSMVHEDDHPKGLSVSPPKLEILIHESQGNDQTACSRVGLRPSSEFSDKESPLFLAKGKMEAANISSRRIGGKFGGSLLDMDCRVCHASLGMVSLECGEAMELGCACKDDMGVAHRRCAEAWFKIKGNRICEICGVIANNVTAMKEVELVNYLQERDPGRSLAERTHWWSRIPFCNLLVALLLAGVLIPWMFHLDIF